jgi:two-component system, chemotaxis family, protein-glutamate methylesterase/glutaminase
MRSTIGEPDTARSGPGIAISEPVQTERPADVPDFNVVVIASSAGGITALARVLGGMPDTFPAPIVVLQHLSPQYPSALVAILARTTRLHVQTAVEGARLEPGSVYVAPPDHHVLIGEGNTLHLSQSAPVHNLRPSADLLFVSAATMCGHRAVGVILTGTGRDGAAGAEAINKGGGTVIVQDHASSEFSGMPDAAIATGVADLVVPLEQIASALITLAP